MKTFLKSQSHRTNLSESIFSFHNSYGKHDQSKDMRNYRKASLFDDETKSWAMCARQIKIWLKGEHGIIGGKLRGRINGRSDLQKKIRLLLNLTITTLYLFETSIL